jgi:hypothetical protein
VAARFHQLVQVRDVPGDGERLATAAALKRLENPESVSQPARHRRHGSRGSRTAVQDDDRRPIRSVSARLHVAELSVRAMRCLSA